MKTFQLALHEKALRLAAEEAYQSEIVDTDMYDLTIGEDGYYATKDQWVEEKMEEWLEKASKS